MKNEIIEFNEEYIRKALSYFYNLEDIKKMSNEQITKRLGFPELNSNIDEWKKYCRKVMKIVHPDSNLNNPIYEEIFKRISAYRDFIETREGINDNFDFSSNSDIKKTHKYKSTSRKEELDDKYKNLGWGYKFYRTDGSYFSLLYANDCIMGINPLIDTNIYKYIFIDEMDKIRFLYTELSPYYIFSSRLSSEKQDYFTDEFLGKERLKKIFNKVGRSVRYGLGNGYAGSGNLMNNSYCGGHLERVYSARSLEFIDVIKQKGITFCRKDGTKFKLIFIGKTEKPLFVNRLYKYKLCMNDESEYIYLTENPDTIFDYIMGENIKFSFFKNELLSKNRFLEVFNQNCLPSDGFGYGYPGKIEQISNGEYKIVGDNCMVQCAKEDHIKTLNENCKGRN